MRCGACGSFYNPKCPHWPGCSPVEEDVMANSEDPYVYSHVELPDGRVRLELHRIVSKKTAYAIHDAMHQEDVDTRGDGENAGSSKKR